MNLPEEETFSTEVDEGPSFEDLLYDDTLSDLERIGRYATSSIALQRLVHVKLISETAHEVG
jgi:serine/threonine-protein phosphatase 4 regulatory subunit 1